MSVPSYDDLTPPIPDVLAAETVAQLALFLGTRLRGTAASTGQARGGKAASAGQAPHAPDVYACLHSDADSAALLAIARDFSPRLMRMGDADVVLDVSGLGRLIGEPSAIAAELARAVRDAAITARVAVASTCTAARLLVRYGTAVQRDPDVAVGDVSAALAALPVTLLRDLESLPSKIDDRDRARPYDTFERWGIVTLGDLAALPAADIASRLSRRGTLMQRLARGTDLRPFVPDPDTPRYIERLDLEWPIDSLEPLSFVLARLLEPLAAALERADRGAAAIRLALRLTDRTTHERLLQLPAAMRDPRVLRTLLLLDLESRPPAAAIDVVTIEIDPAPARITQFSLLERALPSPETVSTLTARLFALIGESRVGAAALLDTHAPDAFELRRFAPASQASQAPDAPQPSRASAILRRQRVPLAIRVRVEHGRPVHVAAARRGMPNGAVTDAAGPWRTSGRWWVSSEDRGSNGAKPPEQSERPSGARAPRERSGDHGDPARERVGGTGGAKPPGQSWSRDEWDVALASGAICRIFHDRLRDCWFLEGVYD